MIAKHPRGVPRSEVRNGGIEYPPGEKLFGSIAPVALLVPRRGGVDGSAAHREDSTGNVLVSTDMVLFRSESRIEEWPLDCVVSVKCHQDRMLIALSGRKTVSGLKANETYIEVLRAFLSWAGGSPELALEQLESSSERVQAEIARLGHDLNAARLRLANVVPSQE